MRSKKKNNGLPTCMQSVPQSEFFSPSFMDTGLLFSPPARKTPQRQQECEPNVSCVVDQHVTACFKPG
jgi:hypothetical protein